MYCKLFGVEFFFDRRLDTTGPNFHLLKDGPGEVEVFIPGWSVIVSY